MKSFTEKIVYGGICKNKQGLYEEKRKEILIKRVFGEMFINESVPMKGTFLGKV